MISPCKGIREKPYLLICQTVCCFSEQRADCESVVTPVVTFSFLRGEHICACFTIPAQDEDNLSNIISLFSAILNYLGII